jgi:trehalose-6-phosphate synthase
MLVTPLRDGMNLVAKEYVACRNDDSGTLVLSEFTGAADELAGAFRVNPHDIEGLKEAIIRAAETRPAEARRRMRAMRKRVFEHDVARWAASFLDTLGGKPHPGAAEPEGG